MPKARRPLIDPDAPDVQAFIRGDMSARPSVSMQTRQHSGTSARQHVDMRQPQQEEPMVSVSVKLPESIAEGLRKAMFTRKLEGHTLAKKQDIVAEAVKEWLARHGFLQ